jgi:phospholipid/cholesterol/gamma-HCH transport system permease protein
VDTQQEPRATKSPPPDEQDASSGLGLTSLSTLSQVPVAVVSQTAEHSERLAARIGEEVREALTYLGMLSKLSWSFFRAVVRPPLGTRAFIEQCEAIGTRSMPVALLILFFVGLVFALQFGLTLQTMGAVPYIGKVVSLSIMRELGPVFTALVVGGRVGAGIAAEIGSMRVTEQVDAIRALGADPVKKLVVPRVLAATLMLPFVALFADIVGICGGLLISYVTFDVSPTLDHDHPVDGLHLGLHQAVLLRLRHRDHRLPRGPHLWAGHRGCRSRHDPHRRQREHHGGPRGLLPHEGLHAAAAHALSATPGVRGGRIDANTSPMGVVLW